MVDVEHRAQIGVDLHVQRRVLGRLDHVLEVDDCLCDVVEEDLAGREVVGSDVVAWLVGLDLAESCDRLLEVAVVDVHETLVEQIGDDELLGLRILTRWRLRAEQVA